MEQPQYDDQMQAAHDLVAAWVEFTAENPQIMLGTHLRSMAIISGLAMRMCGLERDKIAEAIAAINTTIVDAYEKSEGDIKQATLQ